MVKAKFTMPNESWTVEKHQEYCTGRLLELDELDEATKALKAAEEVRDKAEDKATLTYCQIGCSLEQVSLLMDRKGYREFWRQLGLNATKESRCRDLAIYSRKFGWTPEKLIKMSLRKALAEILETKKANRPPRPALSPRQVALRYRKIAHDLRFLADAIHTSNSKMLDLYGVTAKGTEAVDDALASIVAYEPPAPDPKATAKKK